MEVLDLVVLMIYGDIVSHGIEGIVSESISSEGIDSGSIVSGDIIP